MKKKFLTFWFCVLASGVWAQEKSTESNELIGGYTIEQDEVVFRFDPKEYEDFFSSSGIWKQGEDLKIKQVYVSGTFNSWDNQAKAYEMKLENGIYNLRVPIQTITKPMPVVYEYYGKKYYSGNERSSSTNIEFKFVVNGKYWAEPNVKYTNVCSSNVAMSRARNYVIQFK